MQELLMFARPPTPRAVEVEVAQLITSTAEFLKADAGMKNVQIDVAGKVPSIVADPDLLKIVFLNLLINGGQAMDGRGRIAVDVSATDRACRITVLDSGPGVPIAVRDKIFMPFFTTKPKGTGLGLATSKRLIEAQGGTIGLECPESGGTKVSVVLPLR
jgi:two-component system sensor histidine kinase HydH